ncbi:hypothetical protein [Mesorhizobium sp. IMUNJ 23232]|uniref:hypothetical protein n=1 Tax=Mesorhizobium sp. IMUNJ 23232 TaxID=3376064 RepID=UPI0037B64B0E
MGALLYLLSPVAIAIAIWLGIRFRTSSRPWLVGPLSGSVASNDRGFDSGTSGDGGDGGGGGD